MTTNSKGGFVRTEESAIQDSEALRLRSHGLTFREVAAHMCCDVSTAHRRVSRALGAIPRELADEYRALEALRLDALQQAVWEQAIEGDLKAVDRVLSIMKRRSQLLGLTQSNILKLIVIILLFFSIPHPSFIEWGFFKFLRGIAII